MEQVQPQFRLSGRPHALSVFHPLIFLPLFAAAGYGGAAFLGGRLNTMLLAAVGLPAVFLSGGALAVSIGRRVVCRWYIEDDVLHFTRGLSRRRELTFRLNRLLYAEISGNPVYSLFGGTRVRLYSSANRRAFFSLLMSKTEAAELVNRIAAGKDGDGGIRPKHMRSGKYAALLGAAASRGTLLPLGASFIFCLFGVFFTHSADLNILAAALWLYALINLLARLAAESRLSVCIVNNGFAIQMGLLGGKRLFVPHRSVVGVMERRSPMAAFCGAARFELVCEGGRRIPCMRWYEGGSGEEAAKRLLNCSGINCTHAADGSAVRQRYVKQMIGALFGAVLVWVATLPITGELRSFLIAAAVIGLTATMAQCIMGIGCGQEFGIHITAGTLRIGGMGLLSAEYLTLRRGNLSAVKIQQGLLGQMRGTCTTELIPKGSRRSVTCRCIPYDKILAITERFY